ncbi:hypothetical protein KKG46_05525 [Patescibacteria group bacterium]|nr:hypothetical protein [Patescibacteria group bacterium]
MPIKISIFIITLLFLGAGCFEATTTPIAETLGPTAGTGAVAQQEGFGTLPKLPPVTLNNNSGIIRINTTLPTLPEKILVVRVPGSGLDLTQFQNLTHAINIPIGMLGTKPTNTWYSFSWQNNEDYQWSFDSTFHQLSFFQKDQPFKINTVNQWPTQETIDQKVTNFLTSIGYDILTVQNISIQQNWLNWKLNTENTQNCISQQLNADLNELNSLDQLSNINPLDYKYTQSPCYSNNFPNYLPITFERVVDQRNIVDSIGKPQIGGTLIYDLNSQKFVYGWLTLPTEVQRSEYSAITEKEMRSSLEKGGLGGVPQGTIDISEVFFSFISPKKDNSYDYEYLIPVLVGQGKQTLNNVSSSYRIVVPLVK